LNFYARSRPLRLAKGGTSIAPPVVKTGGAQIGEMAEGSQIPCHKTIKSLI